MDKLISNKLEKDIMMSGTKKCPFMKTKIRENGVLEFEYKITDSFSDCYGEECMAYDNGFCRMLII